MTNEEFEVLGQDRLSQEQANVFSEALFHLIDRASPTVLYGVVGDAVERYSIAMPVYVQPATVEVVQEETRFEVSLTGIGESLIVCVKFLRSETGMSLRDSRMAVKSLPVVLASEIEKKDAVELVRKIRDNGFEWSISPHVNDIEEWFESE